MKFWGKFDKIFSMTGGPPVDAPMATISILSEAALGFTVVPSEKILLDFSSGEVSADF